MRVYVSSTYRDLVEHRRAVIDALRKAGCDCNAMEDYPAFDQRPLQFCLDDVAECDLYLGIFARRYGFRPLEPANPENKSITELEYRHASKLKKPRLIFRLDPNVPWQKEHIDAGQDKQDLDALLADLQFGHGVGFFTTPDDLAATVLAALRRHEGPRPPVFKRYGVPDLPVHHLERDDLRPLKELVLSEVHQPIGITSRLRVSVRGMGGVGKTVLAAALAWDEEDIPRAFPDGVYWITVGQVSEPELLIRQEELAQALTGQPHSFKSWHQGQAELGQLLADKRCFVILDDVWHAWHADAFGRPGPGCRVLITTRDAEVIETLHAREYALDVLPFEQAIALLADCSGIPRDQMPIYEATEIAIECGRLPVALAMAGGMIEGDPSRCATVLRSLQNADVARIRKEFANYAYPDLLKVIEVSVDALPAAADKRGWKWDLVARYLDFAVFAEDTLIPQAACERLWSALGMSEEDTRDVLKLLVRRSLLRYDEGKQRYYLHDTQFDYLRYQWSSFAPRKDVFSRSENRHSLHQRLLEGYRTVCANGWSSGPDDGYFFSHLATHLLQAGRADELRALLFDFDWLQTKLERCGPGPLLADFELAIGSPLPPNPTSPIERSPALELVRNAIRIASHILAHDHTQLGAHLIGRIEDIQTMPQDQRRLVARMLDQAHSYSRAPWLCPLTQSLTSAQSGLRCILAGHKGAVKGVVVVVTAEAPKAISASDDGTLRVWDLKTGALVRTLEGHTDGVNAVAVTPDGTMAISASDDYTLKVWHIKSGYTLATLEGHIAAVNAVGGLGEPRTLRGHACAVLAVAVTRDGRYAISGSIDKTLKVWDLYEASLARGGEPRTLKGHTDSVHAVAVTPDGRYAISGSSDQTLKVWDLYEASLARGGEPRTLKGHTTRFHALFSTHSDDEVSHICERWVAEGRKVPSAVTSVAVTPDGRYVISGSDDTTLKVWDLHEASRARGGAPRTLKGHTDSVHAVAVTPDGRYAISGSFDDIKVWGLHEASLAGGEEPRTLIGYAGSVSSLAVTPDGRYVISGSYDSTLKVWDLHEASRVRGGAPRTLKGHTDSVHAVAVTPDGRYAISASLDDKHSRPDDTLKMWDLQEVSLVWSGDTRALMGSILALAVTPDGRYAISSSDTLHVWDLHEASLGGSRVPRALNGYGYGLILALAVTPDGRYAISATADKTLEVWDLQEASLIRRAVRLLLGGAKPRILKGHSEFVNAVAVTPDGRHAISGSDDKTLMVWDLHDGGAPRTLLGHTSRVRAVAVTPDGQYTVSGSDDRTLKVWDLHGGGKPRTLKGHTGEVNAVAVTPNGRYVISGSDDHTLKVWDLRTGQTRATFTANGPVHCCAVSPDGGTVVAGDASGAVHFLRPMAFPHHAAH